MPRKRSGIAVDAKIDQPYRSRQTTVTEFCISYREWGNLQELVLREAANGISKGEITLRLERPDGDVSTMADGSLSLVRRGARK